MKIIRPVAVTDASLTSSSASETVSLYNPATSYSAGDRVRRDTTHRIYESAVGANVGHTPEDSPSQWIDVGPSNVWAMFDGSISTQTTQAGDIVVVIEPGGRVDSMALFNLAASTVRIEIEAGASVLHDQTYDLRSDTGIVDWASYWYEEIVTKTDLLVTGLETRSSVTISVTIAGAGTRACGTLIMGRLFEVGMTLTAPRVGTRDYSRIEEDDFGNQLLTRRASAKKGAFVVVVDNDRLDLVGRTLDGLRATPLVAFATDPSGAQVSGLTTIYGTIRDWGIVVDEYASSTLSIEYQGFI